jgi:tetraacyldisaccharide 4'-kinase
MNFLIKAWYDKSPWLWLLWPFSLLVQLLASLRKGSLKKGEDIKLACPVIVIGNITAGGTGKTPLLITLASHLQAQGFKPGIISRGYKSAATVYPLMVTEETPVSSAGDEPGLIARKTQCPVVIDPNRFNALNYLIEHAEVDVVLSDDGLQHYPLPRSFEICVVDGERLFGNGLCLPAGPLRESVSRIREVDAVVLNGAPSESHAALDGAQIMSLQPKFLVHMQSGDKKPFAGAPFKMGTKIQAVAGIGNPKRFFALLDALPYPVTAFPFPDHYQYRRADFSSPPFDANQPIVMTEKDGIKCESFTDDRLWTLDIAVKVPEDLLETVSSHVRDFYRD